MSACEKCGRRPAVFAVEDHPENDGALYFGDQVLGLLLCAPCLRLTEADGPWSAVSRLDAEWQGLAA